MGAVISEKADKFSNGHCDIVLLQFFFHFDITQHQGTPILHTKFQPNILSHLGEMDLNARVDII